MNFGDSIRGILGESQDKVFFLFAKDGDWDAGYCALSSPNCRVVAGEVRELEVEDTAVARDPLSSLETRHPATQGGDFPEIVPKNKAWQGT